ncbi:hypothetical protein DIPPA_00162 [Diplonema papillatum]|nr:hypothetical protein DIPPA_00162 [Diplonema papillatum]
MRLRTLVAFVLLTLSACGASASLQAGAASFQGVVDEEAPGDLHREPASVYSTPVMCRFWLAVKGDGNGRASPAWQPPALPVVHFVNSTDVASYFESNPDHYCKYAHWDPGNARHPEQGWLAATVRALRGRVENELVVEGVGDAEMCRGFITLKGQYVIERERCRFGGGQYRWCKCQSGRKALKVLICVPEGHETLLQPSPLDKSMTCIARLTYTTPPTEQATNLPHPTFTPARPYPTLTPGKHSSATVRTAVLSYVNAPNILDGTAETFRSWVPFLLKPQNMSLFIFREETRITAQSVIDAMKLTKTPGTDEYTAVVSGHESPPIYLATVKEAFPEGLNATALAAIRPRCGCGPLCAYPTRNSPDAFMISSLRYVQGTSVFVQELLRDPRLRAFDFVIKIDWDIRLFRTLTHDIMAEVVSGGRWGFHTGYAANGNGCSRDVTRGIDAYARANGVRPASAGDPLFDNEQLTWHSAFFGVWTGLALSDEYTDLVRFLRNSDFGYSWFRHRWTDQSLWNKIVGFYHKDIVRAMADFRRYRWHPNAPRPKSVMYHRKRPRPSHELCCGHCSTDVDKACYKSKITSPYVRCMAPPMNVTGRVDLSFCER